jgi:hypothetical protein
VLEKDVTLDQAVASDIGGRHVLGSGATYSLGDEVSGLAMFNRLSLDLSPTTVIFRYCPYFRRALRKRLNLDHLE